MGFIHGSLGRLVSQGGHDNREQPPQEFGLGHENNPFLKNEVSYFGEMAGTDTIGKLAVSGIVERKQHRRWNQFPQASGVILT